MPFPMYALSPIQLPGSSVRRTPDSLRQYVSCRLPSTGSEIHASLPARVQATCTFIPVVLCLPEYSSGCPAHDQHGSSVPAGADNSVMTADLGSCTWPGTGNFGIRLRGSPVVRHFQCS